MAAAASVARDVSPEMERIITLEMAAWSLDVTVRYRVSYASGWHKGHGFDPDVTVISCVFEDGVERRALPMLPGLHDAIVEQIEADELQD